MRTKVITLIKQISIEVNGKVETQINRDCTYALEAGLELRDKNPDIKLIVCSMGPPSFKESLQKALDVGYDEAYLLSDRRVGGSDTYATSYVLSELIRYLGFNNNRDDFIILTGRQTSDGNTAHIPSQIAEYLDISQATFIDGAILNGNEITVRKIIENGHQILKLKLPSLISFTPTATPLRRASLSSTIKAKEKKIDILNIDDIGVDSNRVGLRGSPTIISKIKTIDIQKEPPIMAQGDNLIELVNSLIINIKSTNLNKKVKREELKTQKRDEDFEDFKILDFRDGAKDILTWAEVVNNKISRSSLEILNPAKYLAKKLGDDTKVKTVIIGRDVSNLAQELIEYGSDEVIVIEIEDDILDEYQVLPYASILKQIADDKRPEIIIFPASIAGRELAPRVGIKVDGGVTADCIKLDIGRHISYKSKKIYSPLLEAIRPTYEESKLATIIGFKTPQIATIRTRTFKVPKRDINAEGKIERFAIELREEDFNTKIVETIRGEDSLDELTNADIVIGGGKGAREDELNLIKIFAKAPKGSRGKC